ncbi:LysE family transporter [Candidatus Woesearchaeota archaeon]|nr:LysE family transporter [Candidatus Woesearchaeota archaeon]
MLSFFQNVLLGLSLAAPTGPVNIEAIKRGLRDGFMHAFLIGVGAALADTTSLILVFLGLSVFIEFPYVQAGIWLLGAGVLVYLGSVSLKESADKIRSKKATPSNRAPLIEGYILAITNPMGWVWWLGVSGVIMGSLGGISKTFAFLSSLPIILGTLLWFSAVALLLHFGRRFVNEKTMKIISFLAGLILMGFGMRFGYQAILALT